MKCISSVNEVVLGGIKGANGERYRYSNFYSTSIRMQQRVLQSNFSSQNGRLTVKLLAPEKLIGGIAGAFPLPCSLRSH